MTAPKEPSCVGIRSVLTVLLASLLAVGLVAPTGTAAANPPPPTTYYLALGDSLSQGFQDGHITDKGYVDDLYATLKVSNPRLELEKLGCPGESTTTMISGGICPYPEGSQLAQAKQFISDHPGSGRQDHHHHRIE